MPVTRLRLCASILLVALLPVTAQSRPDPGRPTYTIAMVPVLTPTDIHRRWQPLLEQLARDSGLALRFRYYENSESFEAAIANGEPDFALLGPWQLWQNRQQYRPLLHFGRPLTGLVMVRNDSPVQSLTDLRKRSLGMPDGNDLPSGVLMRQQLHEHKTEPRIVPTRTHANGLRSVLLGRVDAVSTNNYSLLLLAPDMAAQLRAIHETQPLPPPALAAARRLPPDIAASVLNALLDLQKERSPLLGPMLMHDIVEADLERDYGMLERLPVNEAAHEAR
ncbi:MAG: PhnD/SsuA/transferrin family substrate-binding protein [Moraxellaceae bacterium]|nr:PhnD/SsuA/transferrin family substrate-binding protein [Moraxellaceae bacterium]